MKPDPFAALRTRDTGVSTSFSDQVEHLEHMLEDRVFLEKRRISAGEHEEHPEHLGNGEVDAISDWRAVTSISPADNRLLPSDWADSLHLLNRRHPPPRCSAERWTEIVLDAHRLAWGWHAELIADEWTLAAIFGVDRAEGAGTGLAMAIKGDRVVNVYRDDRGRRVAAIKGADGYRYHHSRTRHDAPLIWTLGQQA